MYVGGLAEVVFEASDSDHFVDRVDVPDLKACGAAFARFALVVERLRGCGCEFLAVGVDFLLVGVVRDRVLRW